jgi:hypothetical protein
MNVPLILITYGFENKLFSYEDEGVLKLPIFEEPALADLFLKSVKENLKELLKEKDELRIQVCSKIEHAVDVFRIVGTIAPMAIIMFNAAPLVEDPETAVGEIARQFKTIETVINREIALDDWIELLEERQRENQASESEEPSEESAESEPSE